MAASTPPDEGERPLQDAPRTACPRVRRGCRPAAGGGRDVPVVDDEGAPEPGRALAQHRVGHLLRIALPDRAFVLLGAEQAHRWSTPGRRPGTAWPCPGCRGRLPSGVDDR